MPVLNDRSAKRAFRTGYDSRSLETVGRPAGRRGERLVARRSGAQAPRSSTAILGCIVCSSEEQALPKAFAGIS
jgi:hypothetical protein